MSALAYGLYGLKERENDESKDFIVIFGNAFVGGVSKRERTNGGI